MNPHTTPGLVVGVVLAWSLVFFLTGATITARPRDWVARHSLFLARMLDCPYCTGFHVGWTLALGSLALTPHGLTPFLSYVREHGSHSLLATVVAIVLDGFWYAATSYVCDLIVRRIEPTP